MYFFIAEIIETGEVMRCDFGLSLILFAISLTLTIITANSLPSPPDAQPGTIDKDRIPRIDLGVPLNVYWGTHLMNDPSIAWYGDELISAIKDKVGSGKNKKTVTVGYNYHAGIHTILAYGKDCYNILKLIVDNREYDIDNNGGSIGKLRFFTVKVFNSFVERVEIIKDRGMSGSYDVIHGGDTQGINQYLNDKINGIVPAYRNMLSFVWKGGIYSDKSPNLIRYSFLLSRTDKNLDGSSTLNYTIQHNDCDYPDVNPIFPLLEVMQDKTIGLGIADESINFTSFTDAKIVLDNEKIGISPEYGREGTINDFIKEIEKVINGVVIINPKTAQFEIKLARGDYDPETLDVIDYDIIDRIVDFEKVAPNTLTNQVTVTYRDRKTLGQKSVTVQNIAHQSAIGKINTLQIDLPYCFSGEMASLIATRELKERGGSLFSCSVIGLPQLANYTINDVVKIAIPEYGIEEAIVRVTGVTIGGKDSNVVTMNVVQDVFGLDNLRFTSAPQSGWVRDNLDPEPVDYYQYKLAPYFVIMQSIQGQELINTMADNEDAFVLLATKPQTLSSAYSAIGSKNASNYQLIDEIDFLPTEVITYPIGQTETVLPVPGIIRLANGLVGVDGVYILYGDEILGVVDIDIQAETITVTRGAMDTVPVSHPIGERMFIEKDTYYLYNGYPCVDSDVLDLKLLTIAENGTLDEDDAPVISKTFDSRHIRPYNNANIVINGEFYRLSTSQIATNEELLLTWATRNRLTSIDAYIRQTDSSVTPEVGQTTTITIKKADDTVLRTVTGLTATTYTYLAADERADGGLLPADDLFATLKIEIKTVRDGYDSYQTHLFTVNRVSGS